MTNHKTPPDSLERFYAALAEDESSAVDDLLPVARADVTDFAERLRALMLGSVKRVKLERRAKAEQEHRESLEKLHAAKLLLPSTAAQRRVLLERTLQRRPDVREITLQHREFKELSDDDIERLLRKLHHLGALDDDNGDQSPST